MSVHVKLHGEFQPNGLVVSKLLRNFAQTMLFTPLMYNSRHILHLFTVITVAVLAISCSEHSADRLLASADSLMNTRPDSAYSMLDSLSQQNAHASESLRMRIELLKAKAQNKAYIDFTTDSVMLEVADYFDHHGTPNDRMLAHYLLGCTYRDMKEAPMSLQCYYDAVEAADTTSDDCDYGTLCVIYSQMGYLFHQQNSPVHELDMNQKAMHMAEIVHDTLKYLRAYTYCAYAYECLGQEDTAIVIRKNIVRMYDRINRKDLAAAALSALFRHYIENGDLVTARHSLDRYENESGFFNSNGDLSSGHELFYYFKGNYYLTLHNVDSAEFYYRKLLGNCTVDNEEAGYRGLMQLYEELGKMDSVAKYARLYTNANDAYSVKHSSEEINRMKALYDYTRNQKIAHQKELEAQQNKLVLYAFIVAAIIVALLVFSKYRKYKNKKSRELASLNSKYSQAIQEIESANEELRLQETDSAKLQARKRAEISRLKEKLHDYEAEIARMSNTSSKEAFLNSDIVMLLKDDKRMVKARCEISDSEWDELQSVLRQCLPSFYSKINQGDLLTHQEKQICVLTLMNVGTKEMSNMLHSTPSRISNAKATVNQKLFNDQPGAQSLRRNILALISKT